MSLRSRIDRVKRDLDKRPKPDQIDILVWVPAGSNSAEGRPPGEYLTGSVLDLVYDGDEPDPAVLARLKPRMSRGAITIVLGLEVVPPPAIGVEFV
jgi:hypothetical protein